MTAQNETYAIWTVENFTSFLTLVSTGSPFAVSYGNGIWLNLTKPILFHFCRCLLSVWWSLRHARTLIVLGENVCLKVLAHRSQRIVWRIVITLDPSLSSLAFSVLSLPLKQVCQLAPNFVGMLFDAFTAKFLPLKKRKKKSINILIMNFIQMK